MRDMVAIDQMVKLKDLGYLCYMTDHDLAHFQTVIEAIDRCETEGTLGPVRSRVFLRSLYLVAGEGDIGFQNLLDTLRLILTSSLSDSVVPHIDPIHYFIDDGICFHSSSPSVELHLFHFPGHEVYEVAFERAPYGALKGIHADTKETEVGQLSIVDCGNLSKDALELTSLSRPGVLHNVPLWREPFPSHIRDHLEKLFRLFADSEANWSFWREWYQGFLDGKPLDWELQRRVALIDDAVWEAGPAAVAREIEAIRAKFDLETRIAELEAERDALTARSSRHGIGGNDPPEGMAIEPEIVRGTAAIWAAIEDLKAETQKEDPDKAAVLRIVETLGAGLKVILAWCGRKGDLAVNTLIVSGISGSVAAILTNPDKLAALIEAAKAWLPFI